MRAEGQETLCGPISSIGNERRETRLQQLPVGSSSGGKKRDKVHEQQDRERVCLVAQDESKRRHPFAQVQARDR